MLLRQKEPKRVERLNGGHENREASRSSWRGNSNRHWQTKNSLERDEIDESYVQLRSDESRPSSSSPPISALPTDPDLHDSTLERGIKTWDVTSFFDENERDPYGMESFVTVPRKVRRNVEKLLGTFEDRKEFSKNRRAHESQTDLMEILSPPRVMETA